MLQARLLPDHRRVVYENSGANRAVWVGDLQDQKTHKLDGHPAAWTRLSFSLDGRLALALNADNTLSSWDVETQTSRSLRSQHRAEIDLIALAPGSRRAIYFAGDAMHVRDLITDRVRDTFGRFESRITRIAFRPDGRAIATAHTDRTIRISSLENTREGPTIANAGDVTDLAVFPDGQRVLASGSDGTVGVWDLNTGRKLRKSWSPPTTGSGKGTARPSSRPAVWSGFRSRSMAVAPCSPPAISCSSGTSTRMRN